MGEKLNPGDTAYLRGEITGANHDGISEVGFLLASGAKEYMNASGADIGLGNILLPKGVSPYGSVCYAKVKIVDIGAKMATVECRFEGSGPASLFVRESDIASQKLACADLYRHEPACVPEAYLKGDLIQILTMYYRSDLSRLGIRGDVDISEKGRKLVDRFAEKFSGSMDDYLSEVISSRFIDDCHFAIAEARSWAKKEKSGPKA